MLWWIGVSNARSGVLDAFARIGKGALVRVRVRNMRMFDPQPTSAPYRLVMLADLYLSPPFISLLCRVVECSKKT